MPTVDCLPRVSWSYLRRVWWHGGGSDLGCGRGGLEVFGRAPVLSTLLLLLTIALAPPMPGTLALADCKKNNETPGGFIITVEDYKKYGYDRCNFSIRVPQGNHVVLTLQGSYGYEDSSRMANRNRSALGTSCKPKVEVVEIGFSRGDRMNKKNWCFSDGGPTQLEFKTNFVMVMFDWQGHSNVTLGVMYKNIPGPCQSDCMDDSCQPKASLVCNGVVECQDGSDEAHCPRIPSSTVIQVIVIVIVLVFVVVCVAICTVRLYRGQPLLWQRRRSNSVEHNQLHRQHPQPHATEVVYVPGTSTMQDAYHREVALCEQQHRAHSSQVNLPPSIRISEDGEEGYSQSQRQLLSHLDHNTLESVRPPPNRTIFDGESPPPYQRSHSVGLHDRHGGKRNNTGSPSGVPRCYSMSSSNKTYLPPNLGHHGHYNHHHNGTGLPSSGNGVQYGGRPTSASVAARGHSRSTSSSSSSGSVHSRGPPPNYSDIISNLDVFSKPTDANV